MKVRHKMGNKKISKIITVLLSIMTISIITFTLFITTNKKEGYAGYYTLNDKKICLNIEETIRLISSDNYSSANFSVNNVIQIFLIAPYNWVGDDLIKPYNSSSIQSYWQTSLAKEDKYLLLIINDKHFLPIVLDRQYSPNDFKSLENLHFSTGCKKIQAGITCSNGININLYIENIGKSKVNIAIK